MGGCLSTDERVQPISHTQLDSSSNSSKEGKPNEFSGPVKTQTRSCTDVFFLVLMGVFLIGLLVIVGYCIKNGEILRLINGYDNCGNICGENNKRLPEKELACHGVDMTDKKFVLIKEASKALIDPKHVRRECVANCNEFPNYVTLLNRCIPNATGESVKGFFSKTGIQTFFHEVSEDLHLCWPEILYLCLIAFGISVILLFLLRYTAGILVWFVLAGVVFTSVTGTLYLWLKWHERSSMSENVGEIEERKKSSYFIYAIVSTIITVVIILVVLVMRKRIQLVVKLFEEAGKAVNSMPLLLCQPIMTFAVLSIVVTMWFIFELWIESSGYLRPVSNSEYLYYKKDTTMKAARWYNLLAMFWFTQFCIGCQHMVIAGAVATWFFTRNKAKMESPISTSFSNLFRFHLGSIALGSLLIALIQFARVILKAVQAQVKGKETDFARCLFRACQCCLYCFEKCLSYITRNAYIEIAIYGENFCRSGQQAFKMLTSNVLRVAAINSVGDFVLFLGKVLVVGATVLIGIKMLENKQGVQHVWVPLVLAGLFAFLVAHCFITVYEMVIDTIFLCFCEDCEMNDGISKPYFMSKGLMEFVENSKKVLSVGDQKDRNSAWSASTERPTST